MTAWIKGLMDREIYRPKIQLLLGCGGGRKKRRKGEGKKEKKKQKIKNLEIKGQISSHYKPKKPKWRPT